MTTKKVILKHARGLFLPATLLCVVVVDVSLPSDSFSLGISELFNQLHQIHWLQWISKLNDACMCATDITDNWNS